jgi:hypothetical protein
VINPVSSALNGTVVSCFEGSTATELVATTTIYIIGGHTMLFILIVHLLLTFSAFQII